MKTRTVICVISLLLFRQVSFGQETDRSASLSLFTGAINYQGDLNPNSFTFSHSNFAGGLIFRKPINRWFTVRAGVLFGKIEAADRWNRDYLKPRNLSFTTSLKEAHAGLEVNVLDMATNRFTPYLYGGIAVFHFNPWTFDDAGTKTYLKPLSTEGQALPQYPGQQPYKLTQFALSFGGGAKYAMSDAITIGVEFSQRKTFTDYLDDVSSHYVDRDVLLMERGDKAVELAYRGGLSPTGQPRYPVHGEQRGTPTEMDWYYFFGLNTEIKLHSLGGLFRGKGRVISQRCPRNVGDY